jgi:hypothetical protein
MHFDVIGRGIELERLGGRRLMYFNCGVEPLGHGELLAFGAAGQLQLPAATKHSPDHRLKR